MLDIGDSPNRVGLRDSAYGGRARVLLDARTRFKSQADGLPVKTMTVARRGFFLFWLTSCFYFVNPFIAAIDQRSRSAPDVSATPVL